MSRPTLTISRAGSSSTIRPRCFLGLARQMFAKAVELDPTFARAYAGIANCDRPADRLVRRADSRRRNPGECRQGARARSRPCRGPCRARRGAAAYCGQRRRGRGSVRARAGARSQQFRGQSVFMPAICVRTGEFERAVELLHPRAGNPARRFPGAAAAPADPARARARRGSACDMRARPEARRGGAAPASRKLAAGAARRGCARRAWAKRKRPIGLDRTRAGHRSRRQHMRATMPPALWAQLGETDRALDLLEKWSTHGGMREQGLDRCTIPTSIRSATIRAIRNCWTIERQIAERER